MSDSGEPRVVDSIPERLADSVKSRGASIAFGEPIEREGSTILPVAFVSYGFGGGSVSEDGGGGGGGAAMPLGVYVTNRTGTRFQPNLIALCAVLAPVLWVGGHAMARIIKALKR